MERREFIKSSLFASLAVAGGAAGAGETKGAAGAAGTAHPLDGKTLPAWKRGEFQVHFIYTGVGEAAFWILPDGTTMLVDCGCHPAINRGALAVQVLPNGKRHSGEWVARYVTRVNPHAAKVDYMLLTHYHNDHAGSDTWGAGRVALGHDESLCLSGFAQAAETLKFGKAFDRGVAIGAIPMQDLPLSEDALSHMRKTYRFLRERDGLKTEMFKVGAVNQVAQLREGGAFPGFRITNICGNGRILRRDGTIRDLYADVGNVPWLNENGMSLGMIAEYGPFRLFSAGDFGTSFALKDGTSRDLEVELAKELDPVDVAKINHHGHHACPDPFVAALRPRVWTACVWDQLHCTADTMARICSRANYPGERLVAPGIFPAERQIEDAKAPWLADVAPEAFRGAHVVLTVAPGGKTYTVAFVTARDESMKVVGARDFVSRTTSDRE